MRERSSNATEMEHSAGETHTYGVPSVAPAIKPSTPPIGDDDRAPEELEATLAIEPDLLEDDAAMIVEQLQDVPLHIRITMKERLLGWLVSQPDQALPLAQG